MKKLLVVLLALTVFGVFAFAEDAAAPAPAVQITSWGRYQANILDSDGNMSMGPSWAGKGTFTDLSLSYDAKTYGLSATAEFGGDDWFGATAAATSIRDYNGWVKPFNGLVKFSAGNLRSGDYRLANNDSSGFNSRMDGYGYMVQVFPVDGLSVGYYNPISTNSTATKFDASLLGFGASYALKDVGTFYTQYLGSKSKEFFLGANVTAIAGLGLQLGYTYSSAEKALINAQESYSLKDAKVDLWCYQVYSLDAKGLQVTGNVSYSGIADITPSLYVSANKLLGTPSFEVKPGVAFDAKGASLNVAADVNIGTSTTWSIPVWVDIGF
jgi:hypothetical protein